MNESDEIRSRIRLARIISSCLRMEERRSEEYYERNLPEQGFIFFKKSQASSLSFSSSLRISRFIILLSLRSILLKRDFDVSTGSVSYGSPRQKQEIHGGFKLIIQRDKERCWMKNQATQNLNSSKSLGIMNGILLLAGWIPNLV